MAAGSTFSGTVKFSFLVDYEDIMSMVAYGDL